MAVVILAGFAWLQYDRNQKDHWECLQKINYRGNSVYRLDNTNKNFHTKDEALEYCLLQKKEQGNLSFANLTETTSAPGIKWDTQETPNNSVQ